MSTDNCLNLCDIFVSCRVSKKKQKRETKEQKPRQIFPLRRIKMPYQSAIKQEVHPRSVCPSTSQLSCELFI